MSRNFTHPITRQLPQTFLAVLCFSVGNSIQVTTRKNPTETREKQTNKKHAKKAQNTQKQKPKTQTKVLRDAKKKKKKNDKETKTRKNPQKLQK